MLETLKLEDEDVNTLSDFLSLFMAALRKELV